MPWVFHRQAVLTFLIAENRLRRLSNCWEDSDEIDLNRCKILALRLRRSQL